MGWIANKFSNWATNVHRREIQEFIDRLSALDSSELGYIVACATHHRHKLAAIKGWDFLEPVLLEAREITIALQVGNIIKSLQKEGKPELAVGLIVWLHTVRAANSPDLRGLGRNMWRELERGFKEVEEANLGIIQLTGSSFEIENYWQFPSGLTPNPV